MSVQLDMRKLEALARETPDRLDDWLTEVATQINNEIKLGIEDVSYGRVETRYDEPLGKRTVIVSRPGDPPNVDTGALVGGMHVSRRGRFHYEISDSVEYGINLEVGIGMAARPFVKPVFDDWRERRLADDFRRFGVLA